MGKLYHVYLNKKRMGALSDCYGFISQKDYEWAMSHRITK